MKMEIELKAVHEDELEKYLSSLGVLEDLIEGKFKCRYCEIKISLDNFLCIFPIGDEIAMSCENIKCYQFALKESKEILELE